MQLPERILSKVDRSGDCWRWRASHTAAGRPQVWLNGKNWLVYRLLYTAEIGPIPDDLTLDHVVCQNGWCCNPHHTEPVSNGTNVFRANEIRWSENTHCPKGHPHSQYRRFRKSKKYAGDPPIARPAAWSDTTPGGPKRRRQPISRRLH